MLEAERLPGQIGRAVADGAEVVSSEGGWRTYEDGGGACKELATVACVGSYGSLRLLLV